MRRAVACGVRHVACGMRRAACVTLRRSRARYRAGAARAGAARTPRGSCVARTAAGYRPARARAPDTAAAPARQFYLLPIAK